MNLATIILLLAIAGIVYALVSRRRKTVISEGGTPGQRIEEAKHRVAVEEAEKQARREREIEEAKERGRKNP